MSALVIITGAVGGLLLLRALYLIWLTYWERHK